MTGIGHRGLGEPVETSPLLQPQCGPSRCPGLEMMAAGSWAGAKLGVGCRPWIPGAASPGFPELLVEGQERQSRALSPRRWGRHHLRREGGTSGGQGRLGARSGAC